MENQFSIVPVSHTIHPRYTPNFVHAIYYPDLNEFHNFGYVDRDILETNKHTIGIWRVTPIEKVNLPIEVIGEKKYLPMFKYSTLGWAYFLPTQTMYLGTLKDAKEIIGKHKREAINEGWEVEYKIMEIVSVIGDSTWTATFENRNYLSDSGKSNIDE